jgi:uncharacterized protein
LCARPELAILDFELAELYQAVSKQQKSALNQSEWLKRRDSMLNSGSGNIIDHYLLRIIELYRLKEKEERKVTN